MATIILARDRHWPDRPVVTLLVNRDSDTRAKYAEFLRLCGQEVDEARDGREALAKALSLHPDVIVTGTRLPGISGVDLCKLLRRDVMTAMIPIIFTTCDPSEAGDADRAVRAGATSVLTTPCLPDRLASEIQQILIRLHTFDEESTVGAAAPPAGPEPVHDAQSTNRRVMLNHVHGRGMTTEPPIRPRALVCPSCCQPLQYARSYIGGVSARHAEQWDYFECNTGCGTFQYRQRTRNLRQIS